MNSREGTRGYLLGIAAVVLTVVIAQVALAGASSGSGGPVASSAGVKRQIAKLKRRVAALEAKPDQVEQTVQVPTTLPPSGPAGGDLVGTYPSPTLKPVEQWHDVGAAGEPAFQECDPGPGTTAWANAGGGYNDAGFLRDPWGFVHLRGNLNCSAIGSTALPIFTLPAGYRPANHEEQAVPTGGPVGTAFIQSNGVVFPLGGTGAGAAFFLDGITFRCGPSGVAGCP